MRSSPARIGRRGVVAILAADWIKSLRQVDFFNEQTGDDVAESLRGLGGGNIEQINLLHNGLGPKSCEVLGQIDLSHLKRLELSYNPLGASGAAAVLSNPALAQLKHVEMRDVGAGSQALFAIATNASLRNLEFLDLYGNPPSTDALSAISSARHLENLRYLRPGRHDKETFAALQQSSVLADCYVC